MQKKYLLCVMAFSCIAQAIDFDGNDNAQEDRFAELREDLRKIRSNPDDALFADVMVKGCAAIERAERKKIKQLEEVRKAQENKVSSNRGWWGSEVEGTLVYNADKEIDENFDACRKMYNEHVLTYTNWTLWMHNQLSETVLKNLEKKVAVFNVMVYALKNCPNGDQPCYDLHGAPLYSNMIDPHYRRNLQEHPYKKALNLAHDKNIPVTESELKAIILKNKRCASLNAELLQYDLAIDDMVNPEKRKARELEAQRIKEEEEKVRALEAELLKENDSTIIELVDKN